jgi:hypothetical protein
MRIPRTHGEMVFEVHVNHARYLSPSLSVRISKPHPFRDPGGSWLVWRPAVGWTTTSDKDFHQMLVTACEMVDKSFDRRNLEVVESFLSDPAGLCTAILVMES